MNPHDKKWKEKKLNHYDNRILFDNNDELLCNGRLGRPNYESPRRNNLS